ncbi:MAG: transporter [Zetaproteobacteria bacterium]|nr:MAG: transporter [Zetaproteobacteria bacterium]
MVIVMEINLYDLLKNDQVLIIFTVISLGYLLGKVNILGVKLGNITGVLIAGLFLGSLGFQSNPDIATFGFTIFIFCVGLQAGPSFFSAFASDGARYLGLSIIVAITAVLLCLLFSYIFEMEMGIAAGMLAGSLTSTPTLVGAQDAVTSGLVILPEGVSSEEIIQNISVAYSLTYLFGIGGLMFVIKYIPVLFRVDLVEEAKKIAPARASVKIINEDNLPMVRTYQISNGKMIGKTIRQIQEATGQYFTVLGIRRDGDLIEVTRNVIIEEDDIVSVIASIAQHNYAKNKAIQEVFDQELLNFRIRTKEIVITGADYVGKKVQDLMLSSKYGCFPIGLIRSGIELPIDKNTILLKGDKLEVIGEEDRITDVSEKLGSIESDVEKTDLLTLCLGAALGLLLGTIVINFGQISVGLGSAGGLLIVGILIGFFRSVHPTFGAFPRAARNIMMDLGIVLFMSSIGLNAGSKVLEALASVGPLLVLCGISITVIPVLVAFVFGRYVMKMNAALLLGAITGAMTSTPSLNLVTEAAKSQVPALGYAGSYTFANVILTFAGAILVSI